MKTLTYLTYGYNLLVVSFSSFWMIYGTTFHYTELGMDCKKSSSGNEKLWIEMMIILIIGYFTIIYYSVIFFFYIR